MQQNFKENNTMKKLFIISAIALSIALSYSFAKPITHTATIEKSYSDYSDGWADGYCAGYKYVKGKYIICPVAPVAPVARAGENTYKDGYNRGFVAGKAKAEE